MAQVQLEVDPRIANRGYAHPEVLVSTEWVAEHLDDPNVRIVESDEDVLLYELGHIPGAVKIDWHTDLQDPLVRDFIGPEQFAQLMSRLGITPQTRVVFYGDKNNWWAAYAYWFFRYMGHGPLSIMDGGRKKWEAEGRPLVREVPSYPPTEYPVPTPNPELRAFRDEVLAHIGYRGRQKVGEGKPLVDVRSPGEYRGELLHMPDYPQEGALRGGHIPGAANIPWAQAVREDGTFKDAEELRQLYQSQGVTPDKDVIVYCRIGERSSHTWFVLHELLGYPKVKNYDGSWTEWGNAVGLPIER
ncbi:sulfurtransferase [Thermorudis peleae]|uniref:sulfurtransferase n=1 Tax=Thermorudis peleae TaxID=1382356 RepID=UPI00068EFA59|nr:sulfurtransferase [Thermorudis peleae]MBX6752972.1 sulfurtransferase [Thermorudis peleae]